VIAPAVVPAPAAPLDPSELGEARTPPPGFQPVVHEQSPGPEPIPVAVARGPKLERFGTTIDFFRSPALACDRAAREQKLVMVLHVAGYFDDPGFTWNNAQALRENALTDQKVGEYVGTHFASAYKKVGTFRKDGDTKTGGNVATYFCLPDETVVHVIPGPVDAATFLREARWAVDIVESAALEHPDDVAAQREYLKTAHGIRYLTSRGRPVPRAGQGDSLAAKVDGQMPRDLPRGSDVLSQGHWLLWSSPLPPIANVYRTVWTQVLNEPLTDVPVRDK
jgi:hypothetical protein